MTTTARRKTKQQTPEQLKISEAINKFVSSRPSREELAADLLKRLGESKSLDTNYKNIIKEFFSLNYGWFPPVFSNILSHKSGEYQTVLDIICSEDKEIGCDDLDISPITRIFLPDFNIFPPADTCYCDLSVYKIEPDFNFSFSQLRDKSNLNDTKYHETYYDCNIYKVFTFGASLVPIAFCKTNGKLVILSNFDYLFKKLKSEYRLDIFCSAFVEMTEFLCERFLEYTGTPGTGIYSDIICNFMMSFTDPDHVNISINKVLERAASAISDVITVADDKSNYGEGYKCSALSVLNLISKDEQYRSIIGSLCQRDEKNKLKYFKMGVSMGTGMSKALVESGWHPESEVYSDGRIDIYFKDVNIIPDKYVDEEKYYSIPEENRHVKVTRLIIDSVALFSGEDDDVVDMVYCDNSGKITHPNTTIRDDHYSCLDQAYHVCLGEIGHSFCVDLASAVANGNATHVNAIVKTFLTNLEQDLMTINFDSSYEQPREIIRHGTRIDKTTHEEIKVTGKEVAGYRELD